MGSPLSPLLAEICMDRFVWIEVKKNVAKWKSVANYFHYYFLSRKVVLFHKGTQKKIVLRSIF